MQAAEVDVVFFQGAVSVEQGDGWLRPWRLPCDRLPLFIAPGDSLVGRAKESSGVRLRFETDATTIELDFLPITVQPLASERMLDLVIDGGIAASAAAPMGAEVARFDALPSGVKTVEIWLPHDAPIEVKELRVNDGAFCRPVDDPRPKWVTYGSSLTHCRRANSSARTWPAIVAREKGLNVTALGYGGNCCLEPMMGMMIRDLPADFISLKLGINCISGALSPRTFAAAVTGMVQIIREKHPLTPVALISPIGYPPRETEANVLGYTIQGMRNDIEEVYTRLQRLGDENIYYFNGLDIFNLDEIAEYTQDQCHPNGDGIELMGRHFLERIMPAIEI